MVSCEPSELWPLAGLRVFMTGRTGFVGRAGRSAALHGSADLNVCVLSRHPACLLRDWPAARSIRSRYGPDISKAAKLGRTVSTSLQQAIAQSARLIYARESTRTSEYGKSAVEPRLEAPQKAP